MTHLHDHDNDDIERELYQLGLTDVPPPPPPALRGALPSAWPPASSTRSRSAPSIQEDSLVDPPPVLINPRPLPPGRNPGPPPHEPLTAFTSVAGDVGGRGRLGLWGGAPPPISGLHHSLTNLTGDNPGRNHPPPPPQTKRSPAALFNGGLTTAAAATTSEEAAAALAGLPVSAYTTAAGVVWTQDPGAVHYPVYVMPQDFNKLPRGPRDASPRTVLAEEDEERLAALVSSVEAALRSIHLGLQESYIMYENPDDEEDPPPPQPVTASLRDPPPSPVPPTELPGSPPPPASPQGPHPPPAGGIGGGAPRLVGPDNASRLSRQLGFIPIQEGAPQPPQPPPRHADHHKHQHHLRKLSKKVKNHKSKVLLSGLMACPGPGFRLLNIHRDSKSGQGFGFSIKGGREAEKKNIDTRTKEGKRGYARRVMRRKRYRETVDEKCEGKDKT
nr:uncharacterized protein LOC128702312 [Cherax quadricarinatus]